MCDKRAMKSFSLSSALNQWRCQSNETLKSAEKRTEMKKATSLGEKMERCVFFV